MNKSIPLNLGERRAPRTIPAPLLESDAALQQAHLERAAQLEFALLMMRIATSPAYRAAGGSISAPTNGMAE